MIYTPPFHVHQGSGHPQLRRLHPTDNRRPRVSLGKLGKLHSTPSVKRKIFDDSSYTTLFQRPYNISRTFGRRRMNVKMTMCVYWERSSQIGNMYLILSLKPGRFSSRIKKEFECSNELQSLLLFHQMKITQTKNINIEYSVQMFSYHDRP